ncbi:MAG: K(+)-transporting ATPase subunit F [Limisphaerales bacterium]
MNCGVPCLWHERPVEKYVGRNLYGIGLWSFHGLFAVRDRLPKTLTKFMENLILGIISVALCVYLIIAMLKPEKF